MDVSAPPPVESVPTGRLFCSPRSLRHGMPVKR
jgi:hypothetical protein